MALLTDAQHEQLNRFRNNVNMLIGYVVILALGVASGMMIVAGLIRAVRIVWP